MPDIPTPKPTRGTPYVATGAPKSPLALALAGWLTAITTFLAYLQGADVDPTISIGAAVMGTVGLIQDYLARREQRQGVQRLADARAEVPPSEGE